MNDKLESDAAAAKLLNRTVEVGCLGGLLTVTPEGQVEKFSLSDPATRDVVIQELLKRGISICGNPGHLFIWNEITQQHTPCSQNYTEAVRNAVIEVMV